MFDIRDLSLPVLAAPMAGSPTTPELVIAAARAGGLGQLAAGYKTVRALRDDIATLRAAGQDTFGVNVFVPEQRPIDTQSVDVYRRHLQPLAQHLHVNLPPTEELTDTTDGYHSKIDLLLNEPVPVVTFTFGCPNSDVVAALHAAGTCVGVTVTTAAEAATAADVGADWLCLQGPQAGGHRATFDRDAPPPTTTLSDLLTTISHTHNLPLVVAGGIHDARQTQHYRSLGASAVQVGTLLLRAHEAGTNPAHADALTSPDFPRTVLTRAFSGRLARGLRNHFIHQYETHEIAEYPALNALTKPLRDAAKRDPHMLNLWAGTGHHHARHGPATAIMERLV